MPPAFVGPAYLDLTLQALFWQSVCGYGGGGVGGGGGDGGVPCPHVSCPVFACQQCMVYVLGCVVAPWALLSMRPKCPVKQLKLAHLHAHALPPAANDAPEQEAASKAAEEARAKEKAAVAEAAALLPVKMLAQAITSRGVKLTAPQV